MSWILAEPGRQPKEFICLGDALVRSPIGICGQAGHTARTTVATLCVLAPARGVIEAMVDATYCPWCRRYYVLDDDFDRLAGEGALCCQAMVPGGGEAGKAVRFVNPGIGDQPFFHSLGYCIGRREDVPAEKRRAILDFAIVNGFRGQEETVAFLEWLVGFNDGRKGAEEAVRRWRDDIAYLESGRRIDEARLRINPDFLFGEAAPHRGEDACGHCR